MASLTPIFRQCARRAAPAIRPAFVAARKLHAVPARLNEPGSHSRTDGDIEVEYPAEHELPSSKPVPGTGGQYIKPTLPTFSLDGRVGVVTGGARGLGLVMAQGMVSSGANVALVDMNSEFEPEQIRLAHADADNPRRGGG